jgi:soluble lytic murein transglycosylase
MTSYGTRKIDTKKTRIILLTPIILLALVCAEGQAAGESKFELRKKYQDAAYLARTGQRTRFLKLKNELSDYSLEPYLSYIDATRRLSKLKPAQVADFRRQYADTPLATSLMQNWLYSLAKRGRWNEYLTHFDPQVTTKILTCFELYAMHRAGRSDEAFKRTTALWLVDYSQPEECDPLFKVWRDGDNLTGDLAWQRFNLSLRANSTSLAGYLMRFLDPQDRNIASLMRQAHRNPQLVKKTARFRQDDSRTRDAIMHGIRRLSQKDANQALDTWESYISSKSFSATEIAETFSYIAIRLALQHDTQNRIDTIPINLRDNSALMEARIRLALHNENWNQVLVLIHALPEELQASDRWRYWNARVLAQSSDKIDKDSAWSIFRELASSRSFYGFLSSDLLGEEYHLEDKNIVTDRMLIDTIANHPGIERALELYALGEKSWARREWMFTADKLSQIELGAAAKVAQNWGWYEQSIKSMIKAEHWDDLDLRFPLAYQDYFIVNARTADIPVNWSLAIGRQESAFMADAKSPSGAMGIMQVMPATAKMIAEAAKVSYRTETDLIDPQNSIKLGTTYLGQMLRRFGNNRILASAAYNAGPNRVDTWLNNKQALDVWIETIPFKETRNYVQNVMVYAVIYSHRLDYEQPMIYPNEKLDFGINQVTRQVENGSSVIGGGGE